MVRVEGIRINARHADMAFELPDYMRESALDDTGAVDEAARAFRTLKVTGSNSRLWMGPGSSTDNLALTIQGNSNRVILGSNVRLRGSITLSGNHLSVVIGAFTTFNNSVLLLCKGARHGIHIGRDCMFSNQIEIRSTDSHSLLDLDTGKRINKPDGVFLGDHIWVSRNVCVMKGVDIGDDNVVGYGALVNKSVDVSNALIIGAPAKAQTRRRVTWSRESNVKEVDESVFQWKTLPAF